MAGDGKVREGWIRITFDIPEEYDRQLRVWAAETDTNRSSLIREKLIGILKRRKRNTT